MQKDIIHATSILLCLTAPYATTFKEHYKRITGTRCFSSFVTSSGSMNDYAPNNEGENNRDSNKQHHDTQSSERDVDFWVFGEKPASFDTTQVPTFDDERRTDPTSADQTDQRLFSYAISGGMGAVCAIAAKSIAINLAATVGPSRQATSGGFAEVDLAKIKEGKNAVVKWRGKPVFIRHRTPAEIEEARNVDVAALRHPQSDAQRVQDPRFLVMVGICTHLGCVPIGESGDYGGWFCPCHGSHYDISGRVRQGPAPLNMEIPPYRFVEDNKIVIG